MNWTIRTLGEISDEVDGIIQTGPFGSQLHESDYVAVGVPVVMPKNIIDGRISTEDIAYISERDAKRLDRHILEIGDIVYGRRGDIGRRALIRERERGWMCGTGCLRLSLGSTVLNPVYLYYFLGQPSVIDWISSQAIGATLPNLNTSILRSVSIKYPPLAVQNRIASILTSYDDLIENNIRRIALLKEMGQMIFRDQLSES
jgi:type I restriction enzyme, S subunit